MGAPVSSPYASDSASVHLQFSQLYSMNILYVPVLKRKTFQIFKLIHTP